MTIYDDLGDEPIRSYLLDCDQDVVKRAGDIASVMNAKKWGGRVDLGFIKSSVSIFNKCDLLQERIIQVGGYSGGPLGIRELKYSAVYEKPSGITFEKNDAEISCFQDGHHLSCSSHNPKP